jgi:hypothetical protein
MLTYMMNEIGAGSSRAGKWGDLLTFSIAVGCVATGVGDIICGAAAVGSLVLGTSAAYYKTNGDIWATVVEFGESAVLGGIGAAAKPIMKLTIKKAAPIIAQAAKQVTPNVSQRAIGRVVVTTKRSIVNTIGYGTALIDAARPKAAEASSTDYLKSVNQLVMSFL